MDQWQFSKKSEGATVLNLPSIVKVVENLPEYLSFYEKNVYATTEAQANTVFS